MNWAVLPPGTRGPLHLVDVSIPKPVKGHLRKIWVKVVSETFLWWLLVTPRKHRHQKLGMGVSGLGEKSWRQYWSTFLNSLYCQQPFFLFNGVVFDLQCCIRIASSLNSTEQNSVFKKRHQRLESDSQYVEALYQQFNWKYFYFLYFWHTLWEADQGSNPCLPAVEEQSLNHWPCGKVLKYFS